MEVFYKRLSARNIFIISYIVFTTSIFWGKIDHMDCSVPGGKNMKQ